MDKVKNIFKKIIIKMKFPGRCIKYLIRKPLYEKICSKLNIQFYTDIETVNKIVNEKKSLARFGDGEIKWLLNKKSSGFQDNSTELALKLKETLLNTNKNLLIGWPSVFSSSMVKSFKLELKMYWVYFVVEHSSALYQIIQKKVYSYANITRFYFDYKDKSYAKERLENIKRIWNGKEILIIEGSKTKLGVGNDLLDNALKVERIICPAKNAFDKYDEIFENCKKYGKNKLMLLALGPTATVLASELCNLNNETIEYQAIDIGHVDIEYEWMKRDSKSKISIEGKFVNESHENDLSNKKFSTDVEDIYEKSIICRIDL